MFQREVAERIVATPGSEDLRPALGAGRLAHARRRSCSTSHPSAFVPPPKVTSSLVRAHAARRRRCACDRRALERVTEAAFGQRRKMLRQSLKHARRRSAAAARRGRHRPDRARGGYSGRRLRRARARAWKRFRHDPHDKLRRFSLTAYATPLCETIVDCPEPRGQRGAGAHRALRRLPFRPAPAGRLFRARRRQEARRARRPHAAVHARPRDRRRGREAPVPTPQASRPAQRSRSIPGSAAANAPPARPARKISAPTPRHLGISGRRRLCHARAGAASALSDRLRAAVRRRSPAR